MSKVKVWHSEVSFAPGASSRSSSMQLGRIIEFVAKDTWIVAFAPTAISPDALEAMDPLTREVITGIEQVIISDLKRQLKDAENAGDVLSLLSTANPWSIRVSAPVATGVHVVSLGRRPVELSYSVLRGLEDVLRPRHRDVKRSTIGFDRHLVPPPWMLEPKTLWRLASAHY